MIVKGFACLTAAFMGVAVSPGAVGSAGAAGRAQVSCPPTCVDVDDDAFTGIAIGRRAGSANGKVTKRIPRAVVREELLLRQSSRSASLLLPAQATVRAWAASFVRQPS